MNVFELDRSLIDRYASFARSFSAIRAPEISAQVDEAYAANRFWPEPLITINPRYEPGRNIAALAAEGIVDPALASIFAFGEARTPIDLHRHQARALAKARQGESFIVTTGTGSGKSLCFFLPIIDAVVRARRAGGAPRTRAIIIYPMNALANSQLEELEKFVGESGIEAALRPTFARYTGQESDARRREIAELKPDILLTNFMMLELLMTRQDGLDQAVMGNANGLEYLVLDELHTYRGRQGADVAMLVRRVKQRLSPKGKVLCIGTSATMSSAADEQERNVAVAQVGEKLFGEPISANAVIDESLARATDPAQTGKALGATLREAVIAPIPQIMLDEELRTHPLAVWLETEIGLEDGEKLRRRAPCTMTEAVDVLAGDTGLSVEQCREPLATMLSLIGRREDLRGGIGDRAFLAFKLHRFISGAGRAFATLAPSDRRRVLLDGQVFDPQNEEARLYPTFFCRECGQEHHSVSIEGDTVIARPIDEAPRGELDPNGARHGFLIPAVNDDFRFTGAIADYPEDWQEVTSKGGRAAKGAASWPS